jgi:hypothetical protein
MQSSQNRGSMPSVNSVPRCKIPSIRARARRFVNVESVSAVTEVVENTRLSFVVWMCCLPK